MGVCLRPRLRLTTACLPSRRYVDAAVEYGATPTLLRRSSRSRPDEPENSRPSCRFCAELDDLIIMSADPVSSFRPTVPELDPVN